MTDRRDEALERLATWQRAAKAATNGPWEGYYDDSGRAYWSVNTVATGDQVATHDVTGDYDEPHGHEGADAYHIANFSPDVALRLIEGLLAVLEQEASPRFRFAAPILCDAILGAEGCTTPGCPGDPNYAAPGRSHREGCTYPREGAEGTQDAPDVTENSWFRDTPETRRLLEEERAKLDRLESEYDE